MTIGHVARSARKRKTQATEFRLRKLKEKILGKIRP